MNRRFLISALLVVICILVVSGYVMAYGVNLSFPAARRFVVTQGYSAGHQAYDYGFPNHTSVVAARAGTVSGFRWVWADNQRWFPCRGNIDDRGNYIILDHGGGEETRYYHLSNTASQPGVGTSFDRGDSMALSDDTGCSTGPHLHFALYVGGSARDPYAGTTEWVSGSPIPMGYRDQNHNVHGPYAIDYGSIPSLWLGREGEPGAPLDDEIPGAIAGQDANGAPLAEWVQPFEHGYISTVTGCYAYAKTYLPDIRADLNASNWNSTIIVRNNGVGKVTVNVTFYTGDGRVLDARTYKNPPGVPARGVWSLSARSALYDFLNSPYYPDVFEGSAVVYADQDVSVAVRTLNNSQSLAYSEMPESSALGFQVSDRLYFPVYLNGFYNWRSEIHIANVGSGPTTAQVRYYNNAGALSGAQNIPLDAHAGTVLAPAGSATTGGVRIVSSDANQPLAASMTVYHSSLGRRGAYAAVNIGANELYLPSVFRT